MRIPSAVEERVIERERCSRPHDTLHGMSVGTDTEIQV